MELSHWDKKEQAPLVEFFRGVAAVAPADDVLLSGSGQAGKIHHPLYGAQPAPLDSNRHRAGQRSGSRSRRAAAQERTGVPLSVHGHPVHALRRPFPADPIAPECNPQYRGRDDPQGKAGAGAHALWQRRRPKQELCSWRPRPRTWRTKSSLSWCMTPSPAAW